MCFRCWASPRGDECWVCVSVSNKWLRGDLCIRHKRKLSVWLLPMPPHPAWPKSLREPHNISGDKTPPLSSFNHVGVAPPDLGAQTVKALSCGPFGVGTTGQTIRGWDVHRRCDSLRDSLVILPESGSGCYCSVSEGHCGRAEMSSNCLYISGRPLFLLICCFIKCSLCIFNCKAF